MSHHDDLPAMGVVVAYIASIKDRLAHEMAGNATPLCYQNGTFWIMPKDGYFATHSLRLSEGLTPELLYYPRVLVWLPHLLDRKVLTCQNPMCHFYQDKGHPLTVKGWNDNPVAH